MKTKPEKSGYTLIEMIVTTVIIVVLITLTVKVGLRIETNSKEKLTIETLKIIDSALAQFRDYQYKYKFSKEHNEYGSDYDDYNALKFPLDCNDFRLSEIQEIIQAALGGERDGGGSYDDYYNTSFENISNDSADSGCQVMCFWLSKVPESKTILNKIDDSLIQTVQSANGTYQTISISSTNIKTNVYPWIKIVDSWGTTLNYSYYDNEEEKQPSDSGADERFDEPKVANARDFPIITSAGPDKEFGTADDITNR